MNAQSHRGNRSHAGFLILAIASIFTPALRGAVAIGDTNVQIGGFLSQGWLYSSDNNYPTADRGGTWDFREMALNASTTFGSHLRVGGQVFAQRLGDLGGDKVILDWAVADYNFAPAFGVRVGRVKYPKGLYGEALDLDIVRPFVFLPGAVYSPILRDFSASFDGAMVYGSFDAGSSSFDYKAFYGDIPMTPEKGVAEFYNNAGLFAGSGVAKLDMDAVMGGQLVWNTPVSGLKFAYSFSQYKNLAASGPFVAAPVLSLDSNISRFSWNTVSAEYLAGDWVFATEWQRCGGDLDYATSPMVVVSVSGDDVGWDGWYVSASRRINSRFEVGTYYGHLENRFASDSSAPSASQDDYALSVRFDVNDHVLIKIEGHYIDGTYQTFNTPRIPNPSATRSDNTTLFAVKSTFSF